MSARQQLETRVRRYAMWAAVADACAAMLAGTGAGLCAHAATVLDAQAGAPGALLVAGAAGAASVWLERGEKRLQFARRLDARCGCQGALTATLDAPAGRMAEALAAQVLPKLEPRPVWRVIGSAMPLSCLLLGLGGIAWLAADEAVARRGARTPAQGGTQPAISKPDAARELQALRAVAEELRQAALTVSPAAARTALAQAALAADQVAAALEQSDPAQAAAARAAVRAALEAAAKDLAGPEAPALAQPTVERTLERARQAFGLEETAVSGGAASGSSTGRADDSGSTSNRVGSGTLASRGADGTISTPLNGAVPPIVPVPPELLPRQDAEWIARWLERVRSP